MRLETCVSRKAAPTFARANRELPFLTEGLVWRAVDTGVFMQIGKIPF